jgi:hypothetical protein
MGGRDRWENTLTFAAYVYRNNLSNSLLIIDLGVQYFVNIRPEQAYYYVTPFIAEVT